MKVNETGVGLDVYVYIVLKYCSRMSPGESPITIQPTLGREITQQEYAFHFIDDVT